jgi:eukaryotic-like serine/threonine-protein kinase
LRNDYLKQDGQALALLGDALEWPEEERQERLALACGGDKALLERVQRLLSVSSRGPAFLPTQLPVSDPSASSGDVVRIGVYRLTGLLGAGGMGAVWRGERDDGVFEQTVAIKRIRPGLINPEIAARFAAERRILAQLHHKHIAQILDGGEDANGTPYFVMEFLPGDSITQHSRANRLSLQDLLDLFEQTCEAVQFAHQNFIVHADIKPSNIIVAKENGVKLLDFGIARLVDRQLGAVARSDDPEPMTRAYAAPERVAGGPPSVAGDVYSLGVLLYELLVGSLPRNLTETGTATVVPEGAPTAPWRLPSIVAADEDSPPVAPRSLAGDLDAIVLKALGTEPAGRYQNVADLLEDIRRFRRFEPVSAREDSLAYRSALFFRRHRTGVALTVAALIGLGAAAGISYFQFSKAEAARKAEAHRFDQVRSLANFMIYDLYDGIERLPGSTTTRRALVDRAQQYVEDLAQDRAAPIDLKVDAARGFSRLADVSGSPGASSLSDPVMARKSLASAEKILQQVLAVEPVNTEALLSLASLKVQKSNFANYDDDDPATSQRLAMEAIAVLQKLPPGFRNNHDYQIRYWNATQSLADAQVWLDKPAEALRNLNQITAEMISATWLRQRPSRDAVTLILQYNRLGDAIYYTGKKKESMVSYQTAIDLGKELSRGRPKDPILAHFLSRSYWAIGSVQEEFELWPEARANLEQATGIARDMLSLDPDDANMRRRLFIASTPLSSVYANMGLHDRAIALVKEQLAQRRAFLAQEPDEPKRRRDVLASMRPLGMVFNTAGRRTEACYWFRRAKREWQMLIDEGKASAMDLKVELTEVNNEERQCKGVPLIDHEP